jgi:hypothetical protein
MASSSSSSSSLSDFIRSEKKSDLYVEFLSRKLFPFLILIRNQHFNPKKDLEFCNEFLHNVITFAKNKDLKDLNDLKDDQAVNEYLFKIVNVQPFFEFVIFIGLHNFLIQRAVEIIQVSKKKEKNVDLELIRNCSMFLKKFSFSVHV